MFALLLGILFLLIIGEEFQLISSTVTPASSLSSAFLYPVCRYQDQLAYPLFCSVLFCSGSRSPGIVIFRFEAVKRKGRRENFDCFFEHLLMWINQEQGKGEGLDNSIFWKIVLFEWGKNGNSSATFVHDINALISETSSFLINEQSAAANKTIFKMYVRNSRLGKFLPIEEKNFLAKFFK